MTSSNKNKGTALAILQKNYLDLFELLPSNIKQMEVSQHYQF